MVDLLMGATCGESSLAGDAVAVGEVA